MPELQIVDKLELIQENIVAIVAYVQPILTESDYETCTHYIPTSS